MTISNDTQSVTRKDGDLTEKRFHVCSDHHFGHNNIWTESYANRPVFSTGEMNEMLLTIHNERVGVNDTVFFLGDVAMGKIAESLPLVERMNGQKVLVFGNHDRMFRAKNSKLERWMAEYHNYFTVITPSMAIELGGQTVLMNHFPYVGDSHDEDRYTEMRPKDEGLWLLHGHTHSKDFVWGERMIHVGVDSTESQYGPIPLERIEEVISSK